MAVTIIGADWMVNGASGIARWLSISEAVIGLTVEVRSSILSRFS
jgi:Ca2+/Na+ antiporter